MKVKNHPETYVVVPKKLLRQVLEAAMLDSQSCESEYGFGGRTEYAEDQKRINELWAIAGFDEPKPAESEKSFHAILDENKRLRARIEELQAQRDSRFPKPPNQKGVIPGLEKS